MTWLQRPCGAVASKNRTSLGWCMGSPSFFILTANATSCSQLREKVLRLNRVLRLEVGVPNRICPLYPPDTSRSTRLCEELSFMA